MELKEYVLPSPGNATGFFSSIGVTSFSANTASLMRINEQPYRVLLADDQPAILDALKLLFRSHDFDVDTVRSPQVVLESIALREYDALLVDLNYARDTTSGREGIELLDRIKEIDNQLPIVVMTAW